MPGYIFEHEGRQYTPDGQVHVSSTEEHNQELEQQEIEHLKRHPEKLFLYVRHNDGQVKSYSITTWLGTVLDPTCSMGNRRNIGFGWHTYRRAVDCRIFGVRYVGWYMESSGQYCRLRKAKQQ